VAGAGDRVVLRGGSFTEKLIPLASGDAGRPIAFEADDGESVVLTGTSGPAILLDSVAYITIEGLSVEDTQWLEAVDAHHVEVRGCTFLRTPASGTTGNLRFVSSHHNRIIDNTITDGNDNLLLIDSDHNLVQGNTVTEGRHSLWGIRCGDYNIVRNNFFSNTQQKIGEVYDCGEDTSAVPHSFDSTKYNLIEYNVFARASSYYSTSGGNGIQYAGQNGILRRNIFYGCNVGLGMQVYSDEAEYNQHNRVVHNVFYDNECAGIAPRSGGMNNVYLNNILYRNRGMGAADCSGTSPAQVVYRSPLGGLLFEGNVVRNQAEGENVIQEEFGSSYPLAYFETQYPSMFTGNLESEPGFVDANNHDFQLADSSLILDAVVFLTKTASAGSGTQLPLEDASFFYDGHGIQGESGDRIQLEDGLRQVPVTAVDHASNVVTLGEPLSWNAGQGVSLAYLGTRPDPGAFEYGQADSIPPSPPGVPSRSPLPETFRWSRPDRPRAFHIFERAMDRGAFFMTILRCCSEKRSMKRTHSTRVSK
jgi:parallel beta-helix repeat protein